MPPKRVAGSEFIARLGRAEPDRSGGVLIRSLSDQGKAQITSDIELDAADYPFLELEVEGWHPGEAVYLVWLSTDKPGQISVAELPMQDRKTIRYRIGAHNDWRGRIVGIGIGLNGDLRGTPLLVRQLNLLPSSPALLLGALWQSWNAFAAWDQTSINALQGIPDRHSLSPVPVMAAWGGLSLLALALLSGIRRKRWHAASLLLVIAVPWMTVDMLWQHRLSNQLRETAGQFAGKSMQEKHLSDWDAGLYRYAEHLKTRIPMESKPRLFLLHDSVGHNAARLRLQYYLLPLNILNLDKHPLAAEFGDNDYVLLLGELPHVRFNPKRGVLRWSDCYAATARLIDSQPTGQLLKMAPGPATNICQRSILEQGAESD